MEASATTALSNRSVIPKSNAVPSKTINDISFRFFEEYVLLDYHEHDHCKHSQL